MFHNILLSYLENHFIKYLDKVKKAAKYKIEESKENYFRRTGLKSEYNYDIEYWLFICDKINQYHGPYFLGLNLINFYHHITLEKLKTKKTLIEYVIKSFRKPKPKSQQRPQYTQNYPLTQKKTITFNKDRLPNEVFINFYQQKDEWKILISDENGDRISFNTAPIEVMMAFSALQEQANIYNRPLDRSEIDLMIQNNFVISDNNK